jgi:ribonuclease-3
LEENKLQRLCHKLQYQFRNISFLKQALTHRSANTAHNERFEFLGDSLLSTVIANAIFHKFPQSDEGELSRLRASLVRGDMLFVIAQEIRLGDFLILGQGELKSGGFRRASILADALEAIFAAIYLDSDFTQCQQVILHLFEKHLQDENINKNTKDFKTQLQEYLQSKKMNLPQYRLINIEGDTHEQIFHIGCKINGSNLRSEGRGESRRKAEQDAAKHLLLQITNEPS